MLTEPAPLAERLQVWNEAVEAARKQLNIGRAIQTQGVAALKTDFDAACSLIGRGSAMERESSDWLIHLLNNKPRGK